MSILITGGSGFIGSHMAGQLMSQDQDFIVLDNLSNSRLDNLYRLEKQFKQKIKFYKIDLRDFEHLKSFFLQHQINAVIHFAALKSVNESISKPELYFQNNVEGSQNLFKLIKQHHIKKLIFSSSACVYGEPNYLPIDELHSLQPLSPYGRTKVNVEELLIGDDYFQNECSVKILRYFNPIGAFTESLIGERTQGIPNNLMPNILGVVQGLYPCLKVYGDDYNTPDGTAIRDYIHIMDLIDAHGKALDDDRLGIEILNVGTGHGYTVLDIINTFNSVNGTKLPYQIYPRREGDVEACFADATKIRNQLGWYASRNLSMMCEDAYNFVMKKNKL
jgi:UDP-glucose 4-epimerase